MKKYTKAVIAALAMGMILCTGQVMAGNGNGSDDADREQSKDESCLDT
jgi:hypothetical protein